MRRNCTGAVILCLALASPAAAQADTFTVDRASDSVADGDCSTPGGPCTLRGAVERANALEGSDRIVLGPHTVVLGGGLTVTDALTIAGGTIDGDDADFTAIDARADLALEGVRISSAGNSGVKFRPGWGQGGIAAAAVAVATLTVTDSTFEGNSASSGGAIDIDPAYELDTRAVIARSTFNGNRASGEAGRGGAINLWRGALAVENSTFTGNVAVGPGWWSGGGAIAANGSSTVSLTHVTIAGNRAEGGARGGGIHGPVLDTLALRAGAKSFVPIMVTNSIVTGNTSEPQVEQDARAAALVVRPDDCDVAVGTGGGNLESADTCGFNDASDKRGVDPQLGTLGDNGGPTRTLALATTSPARGAGVASACLPGDQRGLARAAGRCDSGAFEFTVPGTPQAAIPQGVVQADAARSDCLSVRRFKIRLRVPRGEVVRQAIVKVGGKRVEVRRGKRLTAIVDLRNLPKKRYRVEITLKLERGKPVSGVRRYWTCTPAIRWTKPPKV